MEQSSGKDRRCLTMFFVFVFPKLIEKYISTFLACLVLYLFRFVCFISIICVSLFFFHFSRKRVLVKAFYCWKNWTQYAK